MNFTVNYQDEGIVITVNKEKLNAVISHELKRIFNEINEEKAQRIILELEQVKYIDSSGLTALLLGGRKCERLILLHINEIVMKMLVVSQLNQLLSIAHSKKEALQLLTLVEKS